MRGASPTRSEEVLDRAVRSASGEEAVDLEAEVLQRLAQYGERARLLRRDAGAGDEAGGDVDGIDCGRHGRGLARAPRLAQRGMRCPSPTSTPSNRPPGPAKIGTAKCR